MKWGELHNGIGVVYEKVELRLMQGQWFSSKPVKIMSKNHELYMYFSIKIVCMKVWSNEVVRARVCSV